MLSRCFLDYSVGVGVFVTGLSQISSFFSYWQFTTEIRHIKLKCHLYFILFCRFRSSYINQHPLYPLLPGIFLFIRFDYFPSNTSEVCTVFVTLSSNERQNKIHNTHSLSMCYSLLSFPVQLNIDPNPLYPLLPGNLLFKRSCLMIFLVHFCNKS